MLPVYDMIMSRISIFQSLMDSLNLNPAKSNGTENKKFCCLFTFELKLDKTLMPRIHNKIGHANIGPKILYFLF